MAPEGASTASDFVRVVPTASDATKCEIEFDLPAGYKVAIDFHQACDDYPEYIAKNPTFAPSPSALRIEGTEGIVDLSGWQVARQFKRKKDLSCLLVYE